MVSQVVVGPGEVNTQLYMAYYRTKKSPNQHPVKSFFKATSGMKALKALCTQAGVKSLEDFATCSLMEVLQGGKYRDVVIWESAVNAKTMAEQGEGVDMSNVADLALFRQRKPMAKTHRKDKKHVKLGWMATKIQTTDEKRILNNMKLLSEGVFTPQQLADSATATKGKTYSSSGTTAGMSDYERREAYYESVYGMGMMGGWDD